VNIRHLTLGRSSADQRLSFVVNALSYPYFAKTLLTATADPSNCVPRPWKPGENESARDSARDDKARWRAEVLGATNAWRTAKEPARRRRYEKQKRGKSAGETPAVRMPKASSAPQNKGKATADEGCVTFCGFATRLRRAQHAAPLQNALRLRSALSKVQNLRLVGVCILRPSKALRLRSTLTAVQNLRLVGICGAACGAGRRRRGRLL
jgi:hypothetical protein